VQNAEPIEMPFGMLSLVDPRNNVLDGGADDPTGRGTFRGVSDTANHRISAGAQPRFQS